MQRRRVHDALQLGRVGSVERLQVAGLERGRRRSGVVLDLEHDLREVDVLLVVVVGRLHDRDAVAGDPVVVHEGADADRVGRELVAKLVELSRRQDHPGAVGELRSQRRVGGLQVDHHGVSAARRDVVDRRDLTRASRALQRLVALQRLHDGGGVEGGAVVELDPLP